MGLRLIYECGGCDATAEAHMERHFDSFNGKGYGFGKWREDRPQDVAPDGWIAYDPWTSCTYCPACWAEITKLPEITHADDCSLVLFGEATKRQWPDGGAPVEWHEQAPDCDCAGTPPDTEAAPAEPHCGPAGEEATDT